MKKALVLTMCAILIPVLVLAAEKPKSRTRDASRAEGPKVTRPTFKVLASEVNDVMAKGDLEIKDYPADDAPERGYAQDETLKVLAEAKVEKTKWYKIKHGGMTGWVKAKDVIALKDKPRAETVAIQETRQETRSRDTQPDEVQKVRELISNIQLETSIAQKELAKATALLEALVEKKSKLESRLFVEEQLGAFKQGKGQQEAAISGLNNEIRETIDELRTRKEELQKLQAQRKEISDTINRLSEMMGAVISGKHSYGDSGKGKDRVSHSQPAPETHEAAAPSKKEVKDQDRKANRSSAMQTVKPEDKMETNKKGFKDLLNRKGERAYSRDIGKFTIARDGDIIVIKTDMSQVTNVESTLKSAIVLKFFEDDGAYFVLNRKDSPLK